MRIQCPRCVIRVDIAHLIKLVACWISCFDHESIYKKNFYLRCIYVVFTLYLRCIGLLSTCTEIDEFIQICTDVLSIAFSTEDKESHCVAAHNRVINRLKSYNLPNDILKKSENSDPDLLEFFYVTTISIRNLYNQAV